MAGEVVGVGAEVDDFRVGDRVMGMTKSCYAELTTIDAWLAMPVPDEVDWVPRRRCPSGSYDGARRARDRRTIHGRRQRPDPGRLLGHRSSAPWRSQSSRADRVLGTSTSRTKLDRLLALGLDEGILIGEEDVGQAVRAATDARGVDVVVDMIGGGQLAASRAPARSGAAS